MGGTQETHTIPTEEKVDINAPLTGQRLKDKEAIVEFFKKTAENVEKATTVHEVSAALIEAEKWAEKLTIDDFQQLDERAVDGVVTDFSGPTGAEGGE